MNAFSSFFSLPITWQLTALSLGMAVVLACGLSLLAAWLLRHRPAPVRYGLLLSALVLCLAAPGLSQLGRLSGVGQVRVTLPPALPTIPADVAFAAAPQTFLPAERPQTVATPSSAPKSRFVFSWTMAGGVLVAIWALGILAGLARLALGAAMVWMLIRSSRPADSAASRAAAERARLALGLRAAPRLRESPMTPMPLVVGLFRPVILLPSGLAERLDAEQLDAVLLHETAHVAHRDPLIGFAQRLAGALFWWCPLLHQVNRRLNELREYICDNYVIRTQGDGFRLARVLVEMAEQAQSGRWLRLAGAMAVTEPGGTRLEARVRRLLAGDRNTVTRMNLLGTAAFSLLVGCAMVTTAIRTEEGKKAEAADAPKVRVSKASEGYTVATTMNSAKITLPPGKWGAMTISSQDHLQWVFEAMVKPLGDEDVELSYRLSLAETKGIREWQEHERRVPLEQWVKMQAETAGPFAGVKEINVRLGALNPQEQQADGVLITSAKINELLATIKVELPKKSCACVHQDSAVFVKDKGKIKVLFCEHCFDFDGKFYAMPAEFYALFRQASAANQATVVLRVRGTEGSTTEQFVGGKLTAKGTWVRILEVLQNKGPEKLAKDGGIEILWDPGDKGLPAAECTVYLEPYRGENWKAGLYSYRLVDADTFFPDYEIPTWPADQPLPAAEAAALTKAEERYAAKAYAEALTQYDAFATQFPKSAAMSFALIRKGRCLQMLKKIDEAIKTYYEVLDYFLGEAAEAAPALLYTAQCYHMSGDDQKAMKALAELNQDKDYAKHPAAVCGRILSGSIQATKETQRPTTTPAARSEAIVRVPFLTKAPICDGILIAGEWEAASTVMASGTATDTTLRAVQPRFRLGYDKEDLYVACEIPIIPHGSWLRAEARQPDVLEPLMRDDYVRLEIRPSADPATGTKYGSFNLQWNAVVVLADWHCSPDGSDDMKWSPRCNIRSMADGAAWVSELAIPLKSLRYGQYAVTNAEGSAALTLPSQDASIWRLRFALKVGDTSNDFTVAAFFASDADFMFRRANELLKDKTTAGKASQPGETDADALLREARELQETADWAKRLNRPAIPLADLLAACRKVTERYPNTEASRKAMLDMADLQWNLGDKEQAVKSYQELAEKLANTPEGGVAFAKVIDARIEKEAFAEALTMIGKYVADPKAPGRDAMLLKGVLAAYRTGDYVNARTMAEQLIKDHPESEYAKKASQVLPQIYKALKLPADTLPPAPAPRKDPSARDVAIKNKADAEDPALPVKPKPAEDMAAAREFLAKGDVVQAARRLDRIVNAKADPEIAAEALWRMAEVYRSCGNTEPAYRAYKILRWDYPESAWAKQAHGRLAEKEFLDLEKRSNAE